MKSQSQPTQLLSRLASLVPKISWQNSDEFCWSPKNQTVHYIKAELSCEVGIWSLLHEAGHAQAKHKNYNSDIDLLMIEVEAWESARLLAAQLKITIDPDHIEDCLDTYRDWLHQRSTCPACGVVSLQEDIKHYSCYNCHTKWSVGLSRFCRSYRRMNSGNQKSRPSVKTETAFS